MKQTSWRPQVITKKEAIAAAKKFYLAGKLTAQSPDPRCEYKIGKYRCAVGAALKPRILKRNPMGNINCLLEEWFLSEESDVKFLNRLQSSHDSWAQSVEVDNKNQNSLEARFCRLIGVKKRKKRS